MGTYKWRFGDYAVVARKQSGTRTTQSSNFFNTKTESRTGSQFSFVLSNRTPDSAFVFAAHEAVTRAHAGFKLTKSTSVGGDSDVHETDVFTAAIDVGPDPTDKWSLYIGTSDVADPDGEVRPWAHAHAAYMTQGERRIELVPVFSRDLSKRPSFLAQLKMQVTPPATGFEFVEAGRSLCALEYLSSGVARLYKHTIWMRRSIDARMQLVLAAAMTAVLQMEVTALEAPAEPAKP